MAKETLVRSLTETEMRDLGFGAVVTQSSKRRLLNRNGTFNVERKNLPFIASINPYHSLIAMSWTKFFTLISLFYLLANLIFATAFYLCGPEALSGPVDDSINRFAQCFFFSVQTFATIGYGHISPRGMFANIIVTGESLFGLLSFALATGMLFARFSRPSARIIFSEKALIAPYRNITSFQFRITNARNNQLIELQANILFSRFEDRQGQRIRNFYSLPLEREKVVFFPLSWTIVHPIDEQSPLYGLTAEDLRNTDAEFLVLLTAIDETFSQTVHTRSSYKFDELTWNARFINIFNNLDNGKISIDTSRLHQVELIKENSAQIVAKK